MRKVYLEPGVGGGPRAEGWAECLGICCDHCGENEVGTWEISLGAGGGSQQLALGEGGAQLWVIGLEAHLHPLCR